MDRRRKGVDRKKERSVDQKNQRSIKHFFKDNESRVADLPQNAKRKRDNVELNEIGTQETPTKKKETLGGLKKKEKIM